LIGFLHFNRNRNTGVFEREGLSYRFFLQA